MARTTRTTPAPSAAVMLPLPYPVANLLTVVPAVSKFDDMVLAPAVRWRIARVLNEQAAAKELAAAGFRPMRKLLLVGPPGVGKTMTASVLATSLDAPLLRVNLHSVIASHLGETAAHLGKIFEHVRTNPRAVYLFDEFDAIAGSRTGSGRENDVAEMRRVVNSLLQFIELDDSASLLIAATNHAEMIDRAMFRRFDDVIELGLPSQEDRILLVQRGVERFAAGAIDWAAVGDAAAGVGHADLVAACARACKDSILGYAKVSTASLVSAISARVAGRPSVESPRG